MSISSEHEQEAFSIQDLLQTVGKVEATIHEFENARLELEFAARGIEMILRHYTPIPEDVRADLQDLADFIRRRLNRGVEPYP